MLLASKIGQVSTVKLLLEQGPINCDCMDLHKKNPLHYAAYLNTPYTIQCLLDSGRFDLNSRDDKGRTPIDIARRNQTPVILQFLMNYTNEEEEEEDFGNRIMNQDSGEEEEEYYDDVRHHPYIFGYKQSFFDPHEEDEFEDESLIKGMPTSGTLYDSSVQNEKDDQYSFQSDTEEFLKAEKMTNEEFADDNDDHNSTDYNNNDNKSLNDNNPSDGKTNSTDVKSFQDDINNIPDEANDDMNEIENRNLHEAEVLIADTADEEEDEANSNDNFNDDESTKSIEEKSTIQALTEESQNTQSSDIININDSKIVENVNQNIGINNSITDQS